MKMEEVTIGPQCRRRRRHHHRRRHHCQNHLQQVLMVGQIAYYTLFPNSIR